MDQRVTRCKKSGFTLVELLVVVAIIALLAGLLLPTLSRAKSAAYRAHCQSNLRELGVALRLYLNDHGVFPTAVRFTVGNWKPALGEYLDQSLGPNTVGPPLACPSRPGIPISSRTYGYNGFGFAADLGLFGVLEADGFLPAKEAEVLAPANMIAIGDGFARGASGQILAASELLLRTEQAVSAEPEVLQFWAKTAASRHQNHANIVFCDGHVELLPNRTLFLDDSEEALRRWNKDDSAHNTDPLTP